MTLTVERNGESQNISAIPSESEDGIYRLGLWVRDSTAGIGTLTYYNPENNTFAALGHGITDVDTGNILTVKSGNILPCRILSVQKSENGNPGELNGSFDGAPLGEISQNSDRGIFGTYTSPVQSEAIPVASPSEIEKGAAYILANVDGGGVKQYSIEITKVSQKANKNMVIEITDETLLSLTGGIVQGMSGAPIIQNGKLAGAITHVFVNNSAKGYGVFAENMIEASENLE
ncbi:MAG: SpoIVB peptidase [Oscillospiraceae bacterium]|nr:SpoIVB peptidase [Oscillospiraceae bacterium]